MFCSTHYSLYGLGIGKVKARFYPCVTTHHPSFLYCRICEYGEPGLDGCAGNEREEIECNSGPEPEACRPTTTPAPGQGTTTK